MKEYKSVISNNGGHRSAKFASHVLPHCEDLVRAIGYRMAYDAAVAANVPGSLIAIFVCNVVKGSLAWHVQNGLLSLDTLEDMQDSAIQQALPHVEKWVADMKVERYVTAPMVSDAAWRAFESRLEEFSSKIGAKL